jgi:3-oxoacyl-[acyl-carrier-protein] synthase II
MRRRVVVTGYGIITPLGHTAAGTWEAVLAGRSGLGPPTLIEQGDHTAGGVCEVKQFEPTAYMSAREARRSDRNQQLALVAADQALRQAELSIDDESCPRIGIYIGTGAGGLSTAMEQEHRRLAHGSRRISPFAVTMVMANGAAGLLAIKYGICGPANTFSTACASGNDAIGHAFRAIRYGELDAVLAGGTEALITDLGLAGMERAQAISTRSSETPRPFDRERDGLIMGEGAGMLVLESLDHARARGATILGEIAGYGQSTDAYHITAPAAGGAGAARAIRLALADAGLEPTAIDYVNAHGTGTVLNDSHETMALKAALGEHAYAIGVSSTKSMTGHIMGATGAIECVLALLAIRDRVLPPTIHYETPDPECDLDYVPNAPRDADVNVVLNNAFGFGGHNGVLILKRFNGALDE